MTTPLASPSLPAIEFAQRTDPGRDPSKQQNEDAAAHRVTRLGHLCVVCDGMGGHSGGQEASAAALAAIFETFDRAPDGAAPSDVLRDAIIHGNARVRALGTDDTPDGRPGSTVVAILLHAGGTEVAHLGDSRAYLIHEGQIFQLTRDHSMVQQMVDARMLTPAQAAVHPDANKITRALGIDDEVEVDVRPQPVRQVAGDVFVLCTDGLSDLVESPEILQVASADPPAQAAGKLIDLANARGGHDNITVQILRARESALTQSGALPATLVQTVPQTVTVPPPAPFIPPAPPPPPSSRSDARARRGVSPSLMAGLVLALVGFVIAMVVLYIHARERGGKSRQVNRTLEGPLPSASPAPVVSLAPQSLDQLPEQEDAGSGAEAPALVPLAPPSVRHSPHRRP